VRCVQYTVLTHLASSYFPLVPTTLRRLMIRVKVRAFRGMKRFVKFTLIWISQNLSIPFWIVGHIHLSVNIYEDIHELLSSLGMNLIVLIGFIIDYKENGKK